MGIMQCGMRRRQPETPHHLRTGHNDTDRSTDQSQDV